MQVAQVLPALPHEPFANATIAVNEWRGRCLDVLTRAETAITECLVAMSEVPGRGANVQLPHLLGQRLEAFAAAIQQGGPFEAEGAPARAVIGRYRDCHGVRNLLCHGVVKVTLDQQGRWTAVFRMVTLRSNHLHRETMVFSQAEADDFFMKVTQMSRDLSSQVGQVRAQLRKLAATDRAAVPVVTIVIP